MRYPKELIDFIKLKLESIDKSTSIARQVISEFGLDESYTLEAVRKKVESVRNESTVRRKVQKKRLFFDIETSYVKARLWGTGKQYVRPEQLLGSKKIICVSYKWQYEDKVHTLTWDELKDGTFSDRKLVRQFIKVLNEADESIAHNGDRFDIKEIRTRAIINRIKMRPNYRSLDTLKKARKYFRFQSNKLDYIGQVLDVGRKLDHEGFRLWEECCEGRTKKIRQAALKKMVDYCEQDVILLEDVCNALEPYIDHNTNYAVLNGGSKWQCPSCSGKDVKLDHTQTTPMGYIKRHMACKCGKQYHISNKSYQKYLTREVDKGIL